MPSGGVSWANKGKAMSEIKTNSNTNGLQENMQPAHMRYTWHRKEIDAVDLPGKVVMQFANSVMDIAHGLGSLNSLLAENDLNTDEGKTLICVADANSLQRLAVTCADNLTEKTYSFLEWAYEIHTPEGRKERIKKMAKTLAYRKREAKNASATTKTPRTPANGIALKAVK